MKLKKIAALILAIGILTCAVALADEPMKKSTEITTTVPSGFVVVIPDKLPVNYAAAETPIAITVTDFNLKAGEKLKVAKSADNDMMLHGGQSIASSIPFAVKTKTGATTADFEYIEFQTNGSKTLYVTITEADWSKAEAGNYTGALNFEISVVPTT